MLLINIPNEAINKTLNEGGNKSITDVQTR